MLEILNVFFFAFHSVLILFNCFGWVSKRLRPWNLASLGITAFSWFFLGIWYGWGYCFCTDCHWAVRSKLGYVDNTNSYIDLLINKTTGLDFPDPLVDRTTLIVFLISLIVSVVLNLKGGFLKIGQSDNAA